MNQPSLGNLAIVLQINCQGPVPLVWRSQFQECKSDKCLEKVAKGRKSLGCCCSSDIIFCGCKIIDLKMTIYQK